jgi:voltage-gated potassium channel
LESGPRLLTRFRLPATLVALTVLYGTLGYLLLEGWSLTDSLYMTVTTLATVGYGEVRPLDPSGKVFTISLIVLGVVALAASIDAVAGALVSGELQAAIRRRRMRKRLDHLQGHYVVCAYGRVGRAAVAELRSEGVPVLVVEPKLDLAELLKEHSVPHLPADPTEEAALRQAGIQRARGLLCAMDSDAANVFITLTARALNPALTIVAGRPIRPRWTSCCGQAPTTLSPPMTSAAGTWGCSPCTLPSWTSSTWPSWPPACGWRRSRSAQGPPLLARA